METENKKKILILAEGNKTVASLQRVLEDSDFSVSLYPNSTEKINLVLKKEPDLIIVNLEKLEEEEYKLCEMLRNNPSTYKIPFILLTPKDLYGDAVPKFVTSSDRFILKPFNYYMVLSFVNQILSVLEREEILSSSFEKTIKGDLSQIPLTDLIQIFLLTKKSGLLTISNPSGIAKIHFHKGSIVTAQIGNIHGIKAVFRIMTLKDGHFEFDPNKPSKKINVTMNTEGLLLEGMRQIDEVENIKKSFPPLETKIVLNKESDVLSLKSSRILHEILELTQSPITIKEVIDKSVSWDLDVYEGLRILFENNILIPAETRKKETIKTVDPLIYKEEFFKLRSFFKPVPWTDVEIISAKLVLLVKSHELEKDFVRSLSAGFEEFNPDRNIYRSGGEFSDVGSFRITEKAFFSIFLFPAAKKFSPLWELLSQNRIGTIMLLESENPSSYTDLKDAAQFLSNNNPIIYAVSVPASDISNISTESLQKNFTLPSSADIIPYTDSDPASIKTAIRRLIEKIIRTEL